MDKYEHAKKDRQVLTERILQSSARKKIIVAGPGTGKTFLFKEILRGKNKTLTLSFVNSLVDDLALELYGISEVRTLHGYATRILREAIPELRIFPGFTKIVNTDFQILTGHEIDFDKIFCAKEEDNKQLDFYDKRRSYYGPYYGYGDVVFQAVLFLKQNTKKIDKYEQILIDEFQDFNPLEVALIDLLSDVSPIVLAGDDDQALYDEMKLATTFHIRKRHHKDNKDYESFTLPYCSRCTEVIVNSTNDIIAEAISSGYLKDRVPKEYIYFPDRDKDKECNENPKIYIKSTHNNAIPYYIDSEIKKFAKNKKKTFSILIITPSRSKSMSIVKGLKQKGYANIHFDKKDNDERKQLFLSGIDLLISDKWCNLGWRIVSEFILDSEDFKLILNTTQKKPSFKFHKLVGKEHKENILKVIDILKRIKNDECIDENEIKNVLSFLEANLSTILKEFIKTEVLKDKIQYVRGLGRLPIKVVTRESSKGLAADLVFITHFEERYYQSRSGLCDKDICNMIVALTRAKSRAVLLSTSEVPIFLKWIKKERIETI